MKKTQIVAVVPALLVSVAALFFVAARQRPPSRAVPAASTAAVRAAAVAGAPHSHAQAHGEVWRRTKAAHDAALRRAQAKPLAPDPTHARECTGAKGEWRCPKIARPRLTAFAASSPYPPPAWSVPYWYVDGSNVTSCASDANTGTSATCGAPGVGPLKTIGQIEQRMGTWSPIVPNGVVVTQLSDHAAGDVWQFDETGTSAGISLVGTSMTIAAGTIATLTPLNRTAGTMNAITVSGVDLLTACDDPPISSGSCNGYMVVDTTSPRAGASAYICNTGDCPALTATSASISSMMAYSPDPPYESFVAGDSFNIVRGVRVSLAVVDYPATAGNTGYNVVGPYITDDYGLGGFEPAEFGYVFFQRVQFAGIYAYGIANWASPNGYVGLANCASDSGVINSTVIVRGGLYQGELNPIGGGPLEPAASSVLDGDAIFTNYFYASGWRIHGSAGFFDSNYSDLVSQPNYVLAEAGEIYPDYGGPYQWGPASFDVSRGTKIQLAPGVQPCDFLLLTGGYTMDGLTTAYAWSPGDAGVGQYLGPLSLSCGNLATYGTLTNPYSGSTVTVLTN